MSDFRYGIFLRPDPATCFAVTQITHAVRQQFGFVAAEVFAPHSTLIGNLQIVGEETPLLNALDTVFGQTAPLQVFNHGIDAHRNSVRYNLNLGSDGVGPNEGLSEMAATVRQTVLPMHVPHTDFLAPNVQEYTFDAHLSLANFELALRPNLTPEVAGFIASLPISPPPVFVAHWYTLFRFQADWSGHWWNGMTWTHVKSWNVHNN